MASTFLGAKRARTFLRAVGESSERKSHMEASGTGVYLSKKKGHSKAGLWAVGQRDRKRVYRNQERGRDITFIIRKNIGSPGLDLPFQPWLMTSKFQELAPNGLCYGEPVVAAQIAYPHDDLTQISGTGLWGRGVSEFKNNGIQLLPEDKAGALTIPPSRAYTEDELEWPYINVIENRLRLTIRPGNKACTARLLVIQFFNDEDISDQGRNVNQITLGDFFGAPGVAVDSGVLPLTAGMNTTMPTARTRETKWKVLTDQIWTMSPGGEPTLQVPTFREINHPHSNVTLAVPGDSEQSVMLQAGRIIWGIFYQYNEDADQVLQAPQQADVDNLPSYHGHYKFKWKLQI